MTGAFGSVHRFGMKPPRSFVGYPTNLHPQPLQQPMQGIQPAQMPQPAPNPEPTPTPEPAPTPEPIAFSAPEPIATFQPFSTNPTFGTPSAGTPSAGTPSPDTSDTPAAATASTRSRDFRNNIVLFGIGVATLIALGVLVYENCYNFDIWYMLATGREILQNGIPFDNPFSQHDGAQIIVQQWLLCVIYYLLYEPFGMVGIATFITIISALIMVSAYRLGRLKKADRCGAEIIALLCIPLLLSLMVYMKMGLSLFSMLAFIWIMFFCEKYRRTRKVFWLLPLAPIALVHVQLHMAFVPFDLLIIFCYFIPNFPGMVAKAKAKRKAKRDAIIQQVGVQQSSDTHATAIAFVHSDYKRIPLLVALIVFAALLLVNPYGIRGALYFFLSYGAADYGLAIPEMFPTNIGFLGINGPAILALIFLGFMALAKRGFRSIDLPVTILFLITTVMVFQHTRNCWLTPLFGYVLICGTIHGWSWTKAGAKAFFRNGAPTRFDYTGTAVASLEPSHTAIIIQRTIAIVLIVAATVFTCVFCALNIAPRMAKAEQTDAYTPRALIETIINSPDALNAKIFNPTRLGGYLEWLGLTPYIDSRVELWNEPISGQQRDYYYEYVDMVNNDWPFDQYQRFLDENDFDYLITEDDSALNSYLSTYGQGYKRLKGNGMFSLWKKDGTSNYSHNLIEPDISEVPTEDTPYTANPDLWDEPEE